MINILKKILFTPTIYLINRTGLCLICFIGFFIHLIPMIYMGKVNVKFGKNFLKDFNIEITYEKND